MSEKDKKPHWEKVDKLPIAEKLASRFRELKALLEEEKKRLEKIVEDSDG